MWKLTLLYYIYLSTLWLRPSLGAPSLPLLCVVELLLLHVGQERRRAVDLVFLRAEGGRRHLQLRRLRHHCLRLRVRWHVPARWASQLLNWLPRLLLLVSCPLCGLLHLQVVSHVYLHLLRWLLLSALLCIHIRLLNGIVELLVLQLEDSD